MNTVTQLIREFSAQDFSQEPSADRLLAASRAMADHYARMEHAIAVLSDLRANTSRIWYGGFSRTLGLASPGEPREVSSIWEEEIFRLIHPDDLARKHLQELCFFHFIKNQPRRRRGDYCLMSRLRMKTATHGYMPVLHRMFYIADPAHAAQRLAMCLYGPLFFEMPSACLVVDWIDGHTEELEVPRTSKILSPRETQILRLIDRGLTSKEIASMLSISIHTVSRHRQEILGKLQVKNSIEACRLAKNLRLL
uniref:helix-turn-helix transcriptional regulator n=1 Tax=Alistipes megaguti TaxID=2364787 RepID=UPI000EFD9460|nr:LuxR C-terminal-related transcriptional regulator [Alistipes megaguti]